MSWDSVAIGDLCKIIAGGTPKRSEARYWGGDIPWVKISDMLQGRITKTEESITEAGLNGSAAKLLPRGTLLVSIFATIGRTAVLEHDACTNQAIVGVIPKKPGKVDNRFLEYALQQKTIELNRVARGVAQANINGSVLKATHIPLPPLAEQKRIAAILDAADALRAKRRESLEQLDTLLQSTFLEMFGDPVTNPMGWDKSTVNEQFDLRNGVNFASDQKGRGILTVDVKNMYGGSALVDTGSVYRVAVKPNDEQILRGGDILFVRSSVKREGVGWACTFLPQDEQVTFCGFIIRARPLSDQFDSMFLVYYFRQGYVREQLISSAGQVAITNISQVNLGRLSIPTPPFELQQRFAAIVESVEQQKAAQRKHLEELDSLFASLQQRAFSGEL